MKDAEKFSADIAVVLSKLCSRAGKEVRQKKPAKWVKALFDIGGDDAPADDTPAKCEAGGEAAHREYYVEFCRRTQNSAFRTSDEARAEKEYTSDIREPVAGGAMDCMEAWWPDGYHHSLAGVTVEWWRARLAVKDKVSASKKASSRWSCKVDGEDDLLVKVGKIKNNKGEEHRVILLGPSEVHVTQVSVAKCNEIGQDADRFTQALAFDYAMRKLLNATLTLDTIAMDRTVVRMERDKRLRTAEQPSASSQQVMLKKPGAAMRGSPDHGASKRPAAAMPRELEPTPKKAQAPRKDAEAQQPVAAADIGTELIPDSDHPEDDEETEGPEESSEDKGEEEADEAEGDQNTEAVGEAEAHPATPKKRSRRASPSPPGLPEDSFDFMISRAQDAGLF